MDCRPGWKHQAGNVATMVRPSAHQLAVAWARVQYPTTVISSYGISSITHNGTGDLTWNFTTAFQATPYAYSCMGQGSGTVTTYTGQVSTAAMQPGSLRTLSEEYNGVVLETDKVGLAVFNDSLVTRTSTIRNGSPQTQQLAHAWILFSGRSNTITKSFGVTSLVQNGAGDYTVNYPSTATATPPTATGLGDVSPTNLVGINGTGGVTATSTRLWTGANGNPPAQANLEYATLIVFRDY